MTSRYRCFICGLAFVKAKNGREHLLEKHRRVLEALLRPLESFHEVLDPEEI